MRIKDEQLKRFLLDAGLISKTDLANVEKIATEEKRSLGEALISHGHMNEDDMRRVESYVLGIPFVLKNQKIDFETLTIIPEPVARKLCAFRKKRRLTRKWQC